MNLYKIKIYNGNESSYSIDKKAVDEILTGVFSWVNDQSKLETAESQNCNHIIEVSFLSEREMLEINSNFRAKEYVTDVLSFSYDSWENDDLCPSGPHVNNEQADMTVGEILICPHQAKRQAADFHNDFGSEIGRLLIHGALHIAGYEHENVSFEIVKEMTDAEDFLFQHFQYLYKFFYWRGDNT
jgi:rRNA maturation RNase YbeY